VFFSFVAMSGCTQMMFRSAEKSFQEGLKNQPYDVVIVPGFPYNGQNWDRVLKMRIHWANFLYKSGYTKNVIFSGSAVATPYIESKVMAAYAEKLGVPAANLFTEEKAEHSTENVYYSFCMARDMGFKKIALATDPYQNSYMRKFAAKFELPIEFLPTVLDTLRSLDMPEPQISLTNTTRADFVKLSHRENFFQRFKGTMGGYIKWHEEDLKKKKYKRRFKNRIIPSSAKGKGQ
jgi:uncharacterized SAM-binding protein YcdF (DUF218 family)